MAINKDILRRYFSGKYSKKDFQHVQDQFLNPENRSKLKQGLEEEWAYFYLNDNQNSQNFDYLLHQVQHRVYLEENEKTRRLKPLQALQKIAAILFVPLFLSFAAYFYITISDAEKIAYAEIQCPDGVRTSFTLPDGTSGFLNNGSTLRYPVPFEKREVTLVGEAFFDVVKNGEIFHVQTKHLDVEVMGTTFNVIAYENEETEEVILQTGKVNVSSINGKNLSGLNPDQQLVFNLKDNDFVVRDVNASLFTAWYQGKLVFRNEGLADVAKRIGRWYNVDIEIADEQLKNYTFHATFMNHSLNEALDLLTYTSPISYKIEKAETNKANEFINKKKVILKMDKTKEYRFK